MMMMMMMMIMITLCAMCSFFKSCYQLKPPPLIITKAFIIAPYPWAKGALLETLFMHPK